MLVCFLEKLRVRKYLSPDVSLFVHFFHKFFAKFVFQLSEFFKCKIEGLSFGRLGKFVRLTGGNMEAG